MPRLTVQVPKYRFHKASGQAVVTLNGGDHYQGRFNSPQSKAEYNRLIGELKVHGGSLNVAQASTNDVMTIDQLILAYLAHVEAYYVKNGKPTSTQTEIKSLLWPLHREGIDCHSARG